MAQPTEAVTYGPRRGVQWTTLAACGVGLGFVALVAHREPAAGLVMAVLGVALVAAGAYAAGNLWLGLPRLVFDAAGVHHLRLAGHRRWAWGDVGTFTVLRRTGKHGTRYALAAYTDARHDLLFKNGEVAIPRDLATADIKISLQGVTAGADRTAADACCLTANDWRKRFGRPEVMAPHDRGAAAAMVRSLALKQRRQLAVLGVFVALAAGWLVVAELT